MEEFALDISAVNRIEHIINTQKEQNYKYLRIIVESGGCSGFQYEYKFTDITEAEDIIISHNNVVVLIDRVSIAFLKGSKLEYIEELGAAYFQISNPNISAKCGCGNSFSI